MLALAADFRASESGMENISAGTKTKNLYVAGNTVNSEADVLGDLVAAGNNINIGGKVEESLFAAGSNLNLKSQIGSNARVAGGIITIDSQVGDDLLAAGGMITLSKNNLVSGDLLLAGGNLTIDGQTLGRAYLSGGTITINGIIKGDVEIKNADKVTLGDNAVIGGSFKYSSPEEATISAKAKILGQTQYTPLQKNKTPYQFKGWGSLLGLFGFYGLLVSFITLLILIWLLPKLSKNFVEKSFENTGSNLGRGLILMIAVPIILILLAVTLIGLQLAFIGGVLYFTILVIMKIVTPLLIGALIMKWIKKKGYALSWLSVLIGVIAAFILTFIPIVGWIVIFGFYLIAIGQVAQSGMAYLKSQR